MSDDKEPVWKYDVSVGFSTKYLVDNPDVFVIISNDESPFSINLSCAGLKEELKKAKNKFEFDSNNSDYRKDYHKSLNVYLDRLCDTGDTSRSYYQQEKKKIMEE